jgi:hypothetical protein
MKPNDTKSIKTIEGLSAYITELDSLRPPSKFGLSSQSFAVTMELLLKQSLKSYFIKNNPEINQKVLGYMHDYRTDKVDSKEMILLIAYVYAFIFFIVAITIGITLIYSLSTGQCILIGIIVSILLLYTYFSFAVRKRRNNAGERHDEEIKRSVHSLIDFGVQFTENRNLNHNMFPIKLRHNDYNGLIYEKKGENNYVGFLKNEDE